MNKYYKNILFLEKRINSLSSRERGLFFLVMLGIVYYLWQALIFDTIFGSKERIEESIKLAQKQVEQLTTQVNSIYEIIRLNPKTELSDRVELLRKEKKKYEDSIALLTKQLIPPKEMSKLLEEILARNKELTLVKMENIPEEPIFKQQEVSGKTKEELNKKDEHNKVQIYKHGVKLELVGTYFTTKNFLQALEQLPWQLLWDELHYEVKDYPYASIKIVIYTLSLQKSYVGM
jgi:MSHA biogenesis protein MshJ